MKMVNLKISCITLMAVSVASCAAIQKAYYHQATLISNNSISEVWGDGVATADQSICVWVGDYGGLYVPMMVGLIGLPLFPFGVFMGKVKKTEYFTIGIWIIPKGMAQKKEFLFDPRKTYVEFENGVIRKPQIIRVMRFKTHLVAGSERIKDSDVWKPMPPSDINGPIVLWDWSKFILTFIKPKKDVESERVEINGLESKQRQKQTYVFDFKDVEKYRYVIPGEDVNGEWLGETPNAPCRKLFKRDRKVDSSDADSILTTIRTKSLGVP